MKFAGTYHLEGDRMIFHSLPTTSVSCNGSQMGKQEYPGRSDTSTVRFSGDQLMILPEPVTYEGEGGGEVLIQSFTENTRMSGNRPGRDTYRSSDFQCPYDGDWNWYGKFLDMNRK